MRENILERALDSFDMSLPSPVIFYGVAGSRMYGLDTEGSDTDVVAVVSGKHPKVRSKVGEFYDVKIIPLHLFLKYFEKAASPEVDFVLSGSAVFVDRSYEPFVNNLRFNVFRYLSQQEAHAVDQFWNVRRAARNGNDHRLEKGTRTMLRSVCLVTRFLNSGEKDRHFDIRFSAARRDMFFSVVPEMMRTLLRTDDKDEALRYSYTMARLVEAA